MSEFVIRLSVDPASLASIQEFTQQLDRLKRATEDLRPAAEPGDPMDETNKAPRVDAEGDVWRWSKPKELWVCRSGRLRYYNGSLAAIARSYPGEMPLDFATAQEAGGQR